MHFQRLIDRMKGTPEERPIAALMLRTMQKARYDAVSLGHFGLAAEHYTHFTSPIRRYPDLVVHRMLRQSRRGALSDAGARCEELEEELPETARHTSEMERRADEAERELLQWKKVRFMADKVGDEYEGFVTGVAPFGLFVELVEHYVEGLVHVSSMADDYYRFVEQQHVLLRREHEEDLSTRRQGAGAGGAGRPRAPAGRSSGWSRSWRRCGKRAGRGRCAAGSKAKIQKRARPGRRERAAKKRKRALALLGRRLASVLGGVARGVLEVADTLAETAAQLRQPVRAEDHDGDHEDDQELGHAKVHTTPVRCAVEPGESSRGSEAPNRLELYHAPCRERFL